MLLHLYHHNSADNMIREPVGHTAGNEDQPTDLPPGIGHLYYIWISYESTVIILMLLKQLVDDSEDNPDEDFGDNEINATQSRKFVSAREYYCFKLQVRKKLFNIILFGGRLFQQWAVDMYIKIETMRLDWYSKPENQRVIRADLYQVTCLF